MSKPQEGFNAPDFSGQSKTLYYKEGNVNGILIENTVAGRSAGQLKFPTAEAALQWCRENKSMLVFIPFDVAGN